MHGKGAVVKNEIENNCWSGQAYLPAPNSLSFAIKNKAMDPDPHGFRYRNRKKY